MRFHIQQDSDIPASSQLYNQICFAIAARHFPPGHRLPSTRQLAMQTGLHRNTISKVYRQLENDGVVEAMQLRPELAHLLPFLLSVQFHPERLADRHPGHRAIFKAFTQACAANRRKKL